MSASPRKGTWGLPPAGTFEDAVDAPARGDYAKALRLIRPLAHDGDASAQFNLGLTYTTGQGVQQDSAAAALWFRKAADQGDAVAEFLLGNQYANGKSIPLDYSETMIWFQRAAEQGHHVAKLYLGVMYAEGRGVPQDYVRAHMWFSLSEAGRAKSGQDSRNGRTGDDPSSDQRSAEARTRLEASYEANSSLRECALRPAPPSCSRTTPLGQLRLESYGTAGHVGS
jgi:TPR repeat protein